MPSRRRDLVKLACIGLGQSAALPISSFYYLKIMAEHHAGRGVVAGVALLAATLVGSAVLTVAAGWIRWAPVRWGIALLVAASTAFVTTATLSLSAPPSGTMLAMAVDSAGSFSDFVAFNLVPFAAGLAAAAMTLVGIGLCPAARRGDRLALPATVAGVGALLLLAAAGKGYALGAAVPGWSGTTLAAVQLFAERPASDRPAPPPRLSPVRRPPDGDVVLIVDESVAGHYLDLARAGGVASGLKPAPAGVDVADFGIAASAANFSVGTNYILRTGGTRIRYRERRASIWAYAHRAGYRTVHIYAQTAPGLQNLMTPAEHREIDDAVRLDAVDPAERDHVVARMIRDLLHDGVREFIYVNKVGAHFPAWRYYPPGAAIYRPTMADRRSGTAARGGALSEWNWYDLRDPAEWAWYRNDYRNAVHWNVAGFFDILLRGGLPAGTTLLYTSDHGEAMRERDPRARAVHGNVDDPLPEEGAVPLVVLTPSSGSPIDWRRAAARSTGESHYRIFPTLLALFGYDRRQVARLFGADMLSGARDPMTYNSNFYGRTEADPSWHRVDPRNLPDPTR